MNPSLPLISKCLKKNKISKRKFKRAKVTTRTQDELNQMIKNFLCQIQSIDDVNIVSLDETSFCNHNVTDQGYFPIGNMPDQVFFKKRIKILHSQFLSYYFPGTLLRMVN